MLSMKVVAKFPAMTRDISLTMSKDVLAGEVEEIIRIRGGKLLESCELFDIYEGEQLREDINRLYKIVFRASDRTLTDDEVNKCMDKIMNGLGEKNVVLRQ